MWLVMAVMVGSAVAGDVEVAVAVDGETLGVTLQDVAPCALQQVDLVGEEGERWALSVQAAAVEAGRVWVRTELEREVPRGRRLETVRATPTFLVAEGEEASMTVDGHYTVRLRATGFEAADSSCAPRELRVVRERVERRRRVER